MAGSKSMGSRWCILRDNTTLKTAVKFRMNQLELNTSQLAKAAKVPRERISSYLNNHHWDKKSGAYVSQRDLLSICSVLGIDISLTVKFEE